jgi:RNA polymerase sigma-70 factor (ECF subfamily)
MTTPARVLTLVPDSPDPLPDDRTLIAATVAGDRRSARTLYERHVQRVHRLVARLCRDEELARDLVQDTFIRAFRALPDFRGDSQFTTWLHRVAVSVTINAMRSHNKALARFEPLDEMEHVARPVREADPDLKAKLKAALDALPDALRLTVMMHDVEGYTHGEIGTMLGVAEGTSKARLFEARAKLRVALAQFA